MSVLGHYTKQPAEQESYSIEFADDLVGTDTIESQVTTIDVATMTIVSSIIVGTLVKVTLAGGVNGTKYKITVTATTVDGRVLQDEFTVKAKDF